MNFDMTSEKTVDSVDRDFFEKIAKRFANVLLYPLIENFNPGDEEYESAVRASEFVLTLVFIAITTTWFLDANIGYKLPLTAYGIALSAFMSTTFVLTDINEGIYEKTENFYPNLNNKRVEDPVTYSIVARFGGVIFFFSGFLIQILVPYFGSLQKPRLISIILSEIALYIPLNYLKTAPLVILLLLAALKSFDREEIISGFIYHIFLPVVGIFVLTIGVRYLIGDTAAAIFITISVLIIQLVYMTRLILMIAGDTKSLIQISRKSKEEITSDQN